MQNRGLQHKLTRVFILQALLISVAVVLGVFISAKVFEDVLVREALEGEARHFWALYDQDPDVARPNTLNLIGYLGIGSEVAEIPAALRSLEPGLQRVEQGEREPIVYVEDRGEARLVLVFDEEQVSSLAFYFGIVPLSLGLIVIYLLSWISYRLSRRAVSPIVKLAQKVQQFDFSKQKPGDLELDEFRDSPDIEVYQLMEALDQFTQRMDKFIDREKEFTRDASHEMRTPLAVIKSSAALLHKNPDLKPNEQRALALIDRTIEEMESLIETLLLLAREESAPLPSDDILVNDLVQQVAHRVDQTLNTGQNRLVIEEQCMLSLEAPEKVLNILFSNLLRNAFTYTDHGEVKVTIGENSVSIADSGIGMDEVELDNVLKPFFRGKTGAPGHGLGLSIVKRFCNRFGWTLKMVSKPGVGTEVAVQFPDARQIGRRRAQ